MFIFKYLIKCPCTLANVNFLMMVCIEASYGKKHSLRLRCLGRAGRVDERGGSGGGEGQADDSDSHCTHSIQLQFVDTVPTVQN